MSFWGQILLKVCECRCAEGCKSDRSRQELSNQSLVAKSGVDTAENEFFLSWSGRDFRYLQFLKILSGIHATPRRERASRSSFNFQAMGSNFSRPAPPRTGQVSPPADLCNESSFADVHAPRCGLHECSAVAGQLGRRRATFAGLLHGSIGQTLQGSFSAVSKPNFASKYAFKSFRRDHGERPQAERSC